ncbi:MAG: universal stress protein [Euryarchaeota archaeon]|nr:universal stress protein [Euryarchaeota archaeon]
MPKVLVCLDGSRNSRECFEPVLPLLKSAKARLTLFHVETPPRLDTRQAEIFEGEARAFHLKPYDPFDDLASRLKRRGFRVRQKRAKGEAAGAILQEAGKGGYDLVVIGSHGHGGFRRAVLGSVSTAVAQKCGVPVLIARPRRRK